MIRELVGRLVELGKIPADSAEAAVRGIERRERLGSTGIGTGIALPHAKLPGLTEVVGVLATLPAGIDFEAIDGKPVQVVCLFLRPESDANFSRDMEEIVRQLR